MDQRHEFIQFNNKNQGRIFLHSLGSVSKHWHRSLEFLFVLSGSVHIVVDDQSFQLEKTDIILINSLSVHELYSEGAELIAFQIDFTDSPLFDHYKNCCFRCCSAGNTDHPRFQQLKQILAKLIKINSDETNELLTYSLLTSLVNELVTNFQIQPKVNKDALQKSFAQLNSITEYIDSNYNQNLSLREISEKFHFSQSYLSRFFKQHMNLTFSDYYNQIKLDHAVNELVSTKKPISEIASDNGFSDARAFVALFKKNYHMLPSEYRQTHGTLIPVRKSHNEENYLAVTNTSSLSSLAKYLQNEHDPFSANYTHVGSKRLNVPSLSVSASKAELKHSWRKLCCVGSTRDLLFEDVRAMLTRLQNDMPFEYVKFHGILSDDLTIYTELPDGSIILSFAMFDKVFDFLHSLHLKPLMQFFVMPSDLASDPNRTAFASRQNVSLPKDINKWNYLIHHLVQHCIDRYGIDEVLTWPFTLWNEPDSTVEMFGFENREEFFKLYLETYRTVKSIHPDFRFGTPGLLYLPDDPLGWYPSFFKFCEDHNCIPDFLNIHFYDDDIELIGSALSGTKIINRLTPDPNSFSNYLDEAFQSFESYGYSGKKVYMTEWNLTVSHRNLINDTCFKSCYLTKNLLENYDRLDSFGYWSLTDFITELQLPEKLFHGGLGLFTMNKLPKAHYNAFLFLTRLQKIKVDSASGWFLTRNETSTRYAMILYNYEHYDKLFSSGEIFDVTETNRYAVFSNLKSLNVSITFKDLIPGTYQIRESYINTKEGSVFDAWVALGAPDQLSAEDTDYLMSRSRPGRFLSTIKVQDGAFVYQQELGALEVRLVEIILHS